MFVWYVATCMVGDEKVYYWPSARGYSYNFGPHVLWTDIGLLYNAQEAYPNLPWVLESVTVAYQTTVYGPVAS